MSQRLRLGLYFGGDVFVVEKLMNETIASTIASTHVDTGVHPVAEQFQQWCSAVVGFEMTRPEAEQGAPFRARVDAWSVGDIVALRGHLEASHSYRVLDTLAQPQNYSFMLVIDGDVELDVKGRSLTVGRGQIVAVDWRQPISANMPPSRTMQIIMPQRVLQAEMGDVPELHGVLIGSAPGRLLTEFVLSLMRELPSAASADAPLLSAAAVKMVAACLSGLPVDVTEADPVLGPTIRERVRRHIEARIGMPGLSVASISGELGISRATLYRAFSASGGITGYLQLRRLEGAHAKFR